MPASKYIDEMIEELIVTTAMQGMRVSELYVNPNDFNLLCALARLPVPKEQVLREMRLQTVVGELRIRSEE